MSTTKPITETGWSKELPIVDGDYFTRADETDCLWIPVRLMDGELLEFGHSEDCRGEYGDCEWLGPFTASDFEQLIRLRKAANDALRFMEWNADPTANNYPDNLPMGYDVIAALREALAHTGEQL